MGRWARTEKGVTMKSAIYFASIILLISTFWNVCIAEENAVTLDRVMTIYSYPSVAFKNATEEIDGPVTTVIREVLRNMGQKFKIEMVPINRAVIQVESGMVDAAFNMSYNDRRGKILWYSRPVHYAFYGIFVRKSESFKYAGDRKQLEGRVIVSYGKTSLANKTAKLVESIPGAEHINANRAELAFRMLKHGRFNKGGVIYAPDTAGLGVIEKLGYENDVVYAGHDKLNIYYLAFSKKNVPLAFVNGFNAELIRLHKNGTMKEIYSRYTGNIKARVPLKEYMMIDMNE